MLTPEATITPGPKHKVTFGLFFTLIVPVVMVAFPTTELPFTIQIISLLFNE